MTRLQADQAHLLRALGRVMVGTRTQVAHVVDLTWRCKGLGGRICGGGGPVARRRRTRALRNLRHIARLRVLLILVVVVVVVVVVLAFGLVVSFLSNASRFLSAGL
jgi:hypothetical protein